MRPFGFLTGPNEGDPIDIAIEFVRNRRHEQGIRRPDFSDLVVASVYRSRHNGVTHVNLSQRFNALDVFGSNTTVNVAADGSVVFVGGQLVGGLKVEESGVSPINPLAAVNAAASALDLDRPRGLRVLGRDPGPAGASVLSGGGVSASEIPARLGWYPVGNGLRLAWQLVIDDVTESHLWNVTVDAETGETLSVEDWTSHDTREGLISALARTGDRSSLASLATGLDAMIEAPDSVQDGSTYRVFAIPQESPNEGPRTVVANPADSTASPFGWHDVTGTSEPDFTTTRGNNAHAYTDRDANNQPDPGSDPDGGAQLGFDFPVDLDEHPQNYTDAAVTNLFYWNNIVHDVMYQYGFDESAGNFQANNYGRGGAGGDFVRAEAADGSGENNANFSTPAVDGVGTPRMQMYLWTGAEFGLPNAVTIDAGSAAGTYLANYARFTPSPTSLGGEGELVLADDGVGAPSDGCEQYNNLAGAIAVVDVTTACSRAAQVANAEAAGASAVVFVHNTSALPPVLSGSMSPSARIPGVIVSQADGAKIKASLPTSGRVHRNTSRPPIRDGDLDAGIVIHEFAHGVSNRLTGGPTVNCLTGREQMGEGWSDYLAIAMLINPEHDDPEAARGMGQYALYQDSRRGDGIRPRPYSRNMGIQPATYDSIKTAAWFDGETLAEPHGIGHVWASMLWDMTWDLIDKHGFNPDINADWSTGGNNLAVQLVIDGLKFQGCRPGFVTARDAIIASDAALTGGENACILWASFARRGLGYSAAQGSSASRNDNDEAFDTHPACRAGFLGRVFDPPTLNTVRSGATVPLVFSAGGDLGPEPLASNAPYSRHVDCDTLATVDPDSVYITPRPLPTLTRTPGNAKLSYDPSADRYTYPWKTNEEWAGMCREVVVTRDDGVQHRAFFHFGPDEVSAEPPVAEDGSLWVSRYDGPGSDADFATAIAASADGSRVFVTGRSPGDGTGTDFTTAAYDAATGRELWNARYDGPASGGDVAWAVGVSPDGSRVYATGESPGDGTGKSDYATVAYDAADGTELWVARYNGPADGADVAHALEVHPDGRQVFVTGQSAGSGTNNDYATVAYDSADGSERWVARYNGTGSSADFARSLAVSPNGSAVFVTGQSPGAGTSSDYATIAYAAADGGELWTARYDGPSSGFDAAEAIRVGPDSSRVFVTGESTGLGTSSDYATIAYDAANGHQIWTARYDGPVSSGDGAQALAVSTDGSRVVVTGSSAGEGTGTDYATLAYGTHDGSQLWLTRYDGPPATSADAASATSVAGSRVFVTGQSPGVGTSIDYTTVAYDMLGPP